MSRPTAIPRTARVRLFELLAGYAAEHVFNPWTRACEDDESAANGPAARSRRLAAHLTIRPSRVLVGEACGYQGCRVTGIPFTSERLVLAGAIPRLVASGSRLSSRRIPWSEPSATIVWSTLQDLGIAHDTILWNAFPWHPHRAHQPLSNRTPTRPEREHGLSVLQALLALFPRAQLYAVGRHAEQALQSLGLRATALRHPAMGGATRFRQALRQSLSECVVQPA